MSAEERPGERTLGLSLGGSRFVDTGSKAAARFRECRQPCGLAVEFTLAAARFGLRICGSVKRGLSLFERNAPAFGVGLGLRQLGLDFREAAALGEAARGAGGGMRRGNEAVPAPQVALGGNQTLTRPERGGETVAGVLVDHADLRQAAREGSRCLDARCKGGDTVRQARVGFVRVHLAPAHRRRWIDRRIQIVA